MITFDFPPQIGGIENRARKYVQTLVKMKHEVIVLNLLDRKLFETHFRISMRQHTVCMENYLGATVYRGLSSPRYMLRVFFTMRKALRGIQIDVIHVVSGVSAPIGLLYLIYGKLMGIKNGISLYGKDILSSKSKPQNAFLLMLTMFLAYRIGVNSRATGKLLPKFFLHKTAVLYPSVKFRIPKPYKQNEKIPRKEKTILFVGRLVKRKGLDDLIRAFKLTLQSVNEAHLTIVGDGPEKEVLVKLVQTLGLKNKVTFTGSLVGDSLERQYKKCDIFVMPSKRTKTDMEGFGMVFLEAGLFKKPCVGTWSGGIPEAVLHGKTGILVPQGDVKALKDAILLLFTDEKLAKKLGENGYKRVISKFTWEKATRDFLGMYQEN